MELTERQLEVAKLLSDGFTYEEAASKLKLHPGTVRMHATVVRTKLGISHKRHIGRKMRELGLLEETNGENHS